MKRLLIATLLSCLLLVGCGSGENEVTQENGVVESTSEVVEDATTLERETIEDISTMENESETIEETSTMENESSSSETSKPSIPIFDDGTKDDIDWNQYSSGNGDDLSFSGSLTLPSGITISTLNKFNASGMATGDGNSWMGDIYSDIVAQNFETMATNFDNFNAMYNGGVINITNGEQIWWRSSMANSSPSLELRKCGDYYEIFIYGPLLDDAAAEAMGWMSGREAEAREALTVLLSAISSQPTTLQNAILQTTYDAAENEDPIIDVNGAWTRVGDCQVSLDYYNFEDGNHFVSFCIKP